MPLGMHVLNPIPHPVVILVPKMLPSYLCQEAQLCQSSATSGCINALSPFVCILTWVRVSLIFCHIRIEFKLLIYCFLFLSLFTILSLQVHGIGVDFCYQVDDGFLISFSSSFILLISLILLEMLQIYKFISLFRSRFLNLFFKFKFWVHCELG